MSNFTEAYFDSSTGTNRIYYRRCVPEGKPRAIVQIAHGIAENIERYEEFMKFLADNGILAVGNDHLGHGKSIESEFDKGFFASQNGWNHVVNDMRRLHDIVSEEYPEVPYIMFGHSMGSFLTRTYIIKFPELYDAVILSGTGHQGSALVTAGLTMSNLLVKINGAHSDGKMLNDIAFGSYLDRIENARTPYDWLSRDETIVDKYIADPLCGFVCTASLYRDMMSGIKFITSKKNIARMDKSKPVYFMSGAEDPVGEYGKGVNRAYKAFCDALVEDVMIRLYPGGRHEMLNETNKLDVFRDILNWINSKI